jgi:hypothetical protein
MESELSSSLNSKFTLAAMQSVVWDKSRVDTRHNPALPPGTILFTKFYLKLLPLPPSTTLTTIRENSTHKNKSIHIHHP